MPVNFDFEGRVYPPSPPYSVGRETVRDFATAIGAMSPLHHEVGAAQQSGYSDVIAPLTFPVVIAQRCEAQYVSDPEAGIDFSRVVHAQESFEYVRPLVAGDEVSSVLRVERIRAVAGNVLVSTRCEMSVDEALVCTVRSTMLVRAEEPEEGVLA